MRTPIDPPRAAEHKNPKYGRGKVTLKTAQTYLVQWENWKTASGRRWSHVNHDKLRFLS